MVPVDSEFFLNRIVPVLRVIWYGLSVYRYLFGAYFRYRVPFLRIYGVNNEANNSYLRHQRITSFRELYVINMKILSYTRYYTICHSCFLRGSTRLLFYVMCSRFNVIPGTTMDANVVRFLTNRNSSGEQWQRRTRVCILRGEYRCF